MTWIVPTAFTVSVLTAAIAWPVRADHYGFELVRPAFVIAAVIASMVAWLAWALVP